MDKSLRVVFADDNEDFTKIISAYFSDIDDIEIVGIAKDGAQAYDMIVQTEPDIAVLDIMMPRVDGLGVMEKLKACPPARMPKVFFLSALGQENITEKAVALGAEYYFIKPFDLGVLADRIRQFGYSGNRPQDDIVETANNAGSYSNAGFRPTAVEMERDITKILHEVGVPANIIGFRFLRDAIAIAVDDLLAINAMTKKIYQAVAGRYNTTPHCVERGIRHAIDVAWNRGQAGIHDRLFGDTLNSSKNKPTNGEFIAMIADKLRLNGKVNEGL